MKAKYQHDNINEYVIQVDNLVIEVSSCDSNQNFEPEISVRTHPTNSEARRVFFCLCGRLENKRYECVYKEEHQ